jgi:hypothetical protein
LSHPRRAPFLPSFLAPPPASGNPRLVKFLQKHGASDLAINDAGLTCYELASPHKLLGSDVSLAEGSPA